MKQIRVKHNAHHANREKEGVNGGQQNQGAATGDAQQQPRSSFGGASGTGAVSPN